MTTTSGGRPRATTRISLGRVAVVILATIAVLGSSAWLVRSTWVRSIVPGLTTFAGYVDVTATPPYPFETPRGPAQQDVILAFVVAGPDAPCTPTWGAYYTLDEAASALEIDRRLSQLRLTGGQARVSFGGALNDELSTVCTEPQALSNAYQAVIERYELESIDLDIEGATLGDEQGNARRAQAIKAVQDRALEQGRSLVVWLTLPVSTAGLTDQGLAVVEGMLAAGVDVAGVNGMAMDFGGSKLVGQDTSDAVLQSARALHAQVGTAYGRAGQQVDPVAMWGRVGITPMIGQNDVPAEQFTLADAATLNDFARVQGVGLLSMWSLNRDSTCGHPLPVTLTVVQTSCSGIDQGTESFADVLYSGTDDAVFSTPSATATATPTGDGVPGTGGQALASPVAVDDPATSPYPIWDPLGTYPGGTKTVWQQRVYQAKWWTSGFAPDTPVPTADDTPWMLIGPVLPGDRPAPLPVLPANTYPQWNATQAYVAGTRVQAGLVPYEAKWWSQGQRPGTAVSGGSPWVLITPTQ